MKAYKYLLCLFALLLSACITPQSVDTVNKSFAAFEISYKQTLVEVESLLNGNALRPETRKKLAQALADVNQKRNQAYAAKSAGHILDAKDQLDLALKSLDILKANLPQGAQI